MENTYKNCKYFVQHYIKQEERFRSTIHGHCIYPRVKSRKRDTKACGYFEVPDGKLPLKREKSNGKNLPKL